MSKFIAYLIPALVLTLFAAVLLSPQFLKEPLGPNDDVAAQITTLENDISREDWTHAQADLKTLDNTWQRIVPRIQFGLDRENIDKIDTGIAQLRGAIAARDKGEALVSLNAVKKFWQDIGR